MLIKNDPLKIVLALIFSQKIQISLFSIVEKNHPIIFTILLTNVYILARRFRPTVVKFQGRYKMWALLVLCIFMFLGCYIAGYIPIAFTYSPVCGDYKSVKFKFFTLLKLILKLIINSA